MQKHWVWLATRSGIGVRGRAELLRRFCPEDQMVRFVSGLVALGLLLSLVGAATGLELDLPFSAAQGQRQQEELSSYLEEQYQQAAAHTGANGIQHKRTDAEHHGVFPFR